MFNDLNEDVIEDVILNQWTYGQLLPELISPGSMPSEENQKTHCFTNTFTDTVSVWQGESKDVLTNDVIQHPKRKGKMWIYFAPENDLLSFSTGHGIPEDPGVIAEHSIFYSSSNGPLPLSEWDEFDPRELTLNQSSKREISFLGYKRVRVTSAAIVIKQIGPAIERSGVLKIGMGYKGAVENMAPILFDKFQNYFSMSKSFVLNSNDEIICRFRLPHYLLDKYAPFDPTISLPYFFIYGEGISTKMMFHVQVIRHFEGITLPQYSYFHKSNPRAHQVPINIQTKVVETIQSEDNIIQSIPSDTPSNVISAPMIYEPTNNVLTTEMPKQDSYTTRFYQLYQGTIDVIRKTTRKVYDDLTGIAKEKLAKNVKTFIHDKAVQLSAQNEHTQQIMTVVDEEYNEDNSVEDNLYNVLKKLGEMGLQAAGFKLSGYLLNAFQGGAFANLLVN